MSILGIFVSLAVAAATDCQQTQGALDIGSGSVKALVAVVDRCEGRLVKVLHRDQRPVAFGEAVEKSKNRKIAGDIVKAEAKVIEVLVKEMKKSSPSGISAVATAAFRQAKNGESAAKRLSRLIDVPIEIISQEREAEIGFLSAMGAKGVPAKDRGSVVVWDIGGGSMQIIHTEEGRQKVYTGGLASVPFKNEIIEKLQKKDPSQVGSPNPLGENWQAAVNRAAGSSSENVPSGLREKASSARWIGIGGVLAFSVQAQVAKDHDRFTRNELEKTLKLRSALTDAEIKSDYRATEISNLALVLGYMKDLKIDAVETAEVSLAEGWLLRPL